MTDGSQQLIFVHDHWEHLSHTTPFLRVDLRMDKSLTFHRQRLTLHGEILNLTNHHNMRFIGDQLVAGQNYSGTYYTEDRSIGFTPTVGLDVQF